MPFQVFLQHFGPYITLNLNGVYFGSKNVNRVNYYIADYSVSGADVNEVKSFFENIKSEL